MYYARNEKRLYEGEDVYECLSYMKLAEGDTLHQPPPLGEIALRPFQICMADRELMLTMGNGRGMICLRSIKAARDGDK